MNWWQLIIPLIFVAVWIISLLAKNRDQAVKNKPPPLPSMDEDAPRSRRSAGEVDRFLEEVRRRRARAEGRPAPPPVAETPRPKPPARRPAPEPARSSPPLAPVPPRLPTRLPPAAQPVARSLRMPPVEITVAEVVSASVAEPRTSERRAPVAAIVARPSRSAGLTQALGLLRSRQSMVAAVVLREILGPPVSKRRGMIPAFRK